MLLLLLPKYERSKNYCFLPLPTQRSLLEYFLKKRKLINCLKIAVDKLYSIMDTFNLIYT